MNVEEANVQNKSRAVSRGWKKSAEKWTQRTVYYKSAVQRLNDRRQISINGATHGQRLLQLEGTPIVTE